MKTIAASLFALALLASGCGGATRPTDEKNDNAVTGSGGATAAGGRHGTGGRGSGGATASEGGSGAGGAVSDGSGGSAPAPAAGGSSGGETASGGSGPYGGGDGGSSGMVATGGTTGAGGNKGAGGAPPPPPTGPAWGRADLCDAYCACMSSGKCSGRNPGNCLATCKSSATNWNLPCRLEKCKSANKDYADQVSGSCASSVGVQGCWDKDKLTQP